MSTFTFVNAYAHFNVEVWSSERAEELLKGHRVVTIAHADMVDHRDSFEDYRDNRLVSEGFVPELKVLELPTVAAAVSYAQKKDGE